MFWARFLANLMITLAVSISSPLLAQETMKQVHHEPSAVLRS